MPTEVVTYVWLGDAPSGRQHMTDLADGVVYRRSELTYQADRLEKAGPITRRPSDDERSTMVTIIAAGREFIAHVMPGHVQVARQMLLDPLDRRDIVALRDVLGRVRDRMRNAPLGGGPSASILAELFRFQAGFVIPERR